MPDRELTTYQANLADIEILFDVCWILSPSQIQKLISQYHNADYESPIAPEILKAVAARVKPDDKSDHLLLTPESEDVGPYQIPPPREVSGIETCEFPFACPPRKSAADLGRRSCVLECACCSKAGDLCFVIDLS